MIAGSYVPATFFKMIRYRLIFVILLFAQCNQPNDELREDNTHASRYDIKINYTDETGILWRQHFDDLISKDSLYIFFETGFKSNLLDIYLNGKLEKSETITTSGLLGLAEYYVFGPMQNINHFGIRIDNGKLVFVEPEVNQNIWRIHMSSDSTLNAQYSEHAPFYE